MLELLRKNKKEEFLILNNKLTLVEILENTKEFNNPRTYFKIDSMGNIKNKSFNLALVKLTFLGNEYLEEYFNKGLWIEEKRKIHKIDRISDLTVKMLEKNLYKVLFNRDLSIAYRYSKEFILKDKELFIKKIAHFILLNKLDTEKSLITLAFIKSLEEVSKKNIDSILYSYLPYIVTFPSVVDNGDKEIVVIEKDKLDLNALGYLNLIKYGYEEFQKDYFSKLSNYKNDNLKKDLKLFERLSEDIDELYNVWEKAKKSNM